MVPKNTDYAHLSQIKKDPLCRTSATNMASFGMKLAQLFGARFLETQDMATFQSFSGGEPVQISVVQALIRKDTIYEKMIGMDHMESNAAATFNIIGRLGSQKFPLTQRWQFDDKYILLDKYCEKVNTVPLGNRHTWESLATHVNTKQTDPHGGPNLVPITLGEAYDQVCTPQRRTATSPTWGSVAALSYLLIRSGLAVGHTEILTCVGNDQIPKVDESDQAKFVRALFGTSAVAFQGVLHDAIRAGGGDPKGIIGAQLWRSFPVDAGTPKWFHKINPDIRRLQPPPPVAQPTDAQPTDAQVQRVVGVVECSEAEAKRLLLNANLNAALAIQQYYD